MKKEKKKTTKQSLPLQPTFADDESLRSIIFSISLQVESVVHIVKDCGRQQVILGRLKREESEEWNRKMER